MCELSAPVTFHNAQANNTEFLSILSYLSPRHTWFKTFDSTQCFSSFFSQLPASSMLAYLDFLCFNLSYISSACDKSVLSVYIITSFCGHFTCIYGNIMKSGEMKHEMTSYHTMGPYPESHSTKTFIGEQ